jgi:ABC-2 type transport system permease protein
VLITWGISLVAVQSYKPDQSFMDLLTIEMQAMFFIELIFLAVGLMLGAVLKQYRRASSIAVAIILVTYFMSIMTEIQTKLDFLKWFTPFKYFDAGEFYFSNKLDGTYLLLSLGIVVICLAAAYIGYNRRDLYI